MPTLAQTRLRRPEAQTHLKMLIRKADQMLRALGLSDCELSVTLCSNTEIHLLNRDFRGKDKPTDVLAFAQQETQWVMKNSKVLGDIVLSLDTCVRQSKAHGVSVKQELVHLLAHGLLHLLGFDHQNKATDRRMRACTDLLRNVC